MFSSENIKSHLMLRIETMFLDKSIYIEVDVPSEYYNKSLNVDTFTIAPPHSFPPKFVTQNFIYPINCLE